MKIRCVRFLTDSGFGSPSAPLRQVSRRENGKGGLTSFVPRGKGLRELLPNPRNRSDAQYLLGRTNREYERLIAQAQWISGYTENAFKEAGIRPGMRILDVGCGVGDVSLLLAKLLGDSGKIVGIDQDAGALSMARKRAGAAGFRTMSFVQGDFRTYDFGQLFDAVVGRYVLMYQADPVTAVQSLVMRLKPGGIIAFQELDMSRIPICWPRIPLFENCFRWGRAANLKAKVHVRMGLDLYRTFILAGLVKTNLHMDTIVGAGPDFPGYKIMAESMRSILPVLESSGIADPDEVRIETLAERLRDAVVSANAIVSWCPIVSAWAAKPVGV
ncbi:MAG: methyltransferase domain-containing protein [Candidatus Acidiferrales bacterium]